MSMNLFMDFSFVALNNGKFRKERLTEYLALLKNSILKKKNYYLRSVFFFSLHCKCSVNVFAPDIRIFVFLMLILYSNW